MELFKRHMVIFLWLCGSLPYASAAEYGSQWKDINPGPSIDINTGSYSLNKITETTNQSRSIEITGGSDLGASRSPDLLNIGGGTVAVGLNKTIVSYAGLTSPANHPGFVAAGERTWINSGVYLLALDDLKADAGGKIKISPENQSDFDALPGDAVSWISPLAIDRLLNAPLSPNIVLSDTSIGYLDHWQADQINQTPDDPSYKIGRFIFTRSVTFLMATIFMVLLLLFFRNHTQKNTANS